MSNQGLPYPDVADVQLTENHLTNSSVVEKVLANERRISFVTDLEFAVMAGWVATPVLVIVCFLMPLPANPDSE